MLSKRILRWASNFTGSTYLKYPDSNQTRSADRRGNSQLKNLNLLASNTYFSSLYWYEFSLTKCRKYWEDKRIIQKYFENKTTNIYPRFRSQWVASRRVSFQFLLHFLDEPLLFLLERDETVQWTHSQPYRQERDVFDKTVVFALHNTSPPRAAILFSFATFATSR